MMSKVISACRVCPFWHPGPNSRCRITSTIAYASDHCRLPELDATDIIELAVKENATEPNPA